MIRQMEIKDIETITKLNQEILNSNWTQNLYRQELLDRYTHALIYEKEAMIAGYIVVKVMGDTSDLLQIAVLDRFKKQGIGKALLNEIWNRLKMLGVMEMLLEVNEKNKQAVNFYERYGFKTIFKRKNYYGMRKDALVMRMRVNQDVNIGD